MLKRERSRKFAFDQKDLTLSNEDRKVLTRREPAARLTVRLQGSGCPAFWENILSLDCRGCNGKPRGYILKWLDTRHHPLNHRGRGFSLPEA